MVSLEIIVGNRSPSEDILAGTSFQTAISMGTIYFDN
jgi:hypothetical protein